MRKIPALIPVALSVLVMACGATPSSSPTAPTATVTAPPPGDAILIRGTVYDTAFRIIPDARVEVLDGPQAGLTAVSDEQGYFGFRGSFDDNTRFQASKSGYTLAVQKMQPFCERCVPQRWVNFELDVPGDVAVVSGTYDVVLGVDPTCPGFPRELRERSFTTTLPATRGSFHVLLSGGNTSGYFAGGVSGDYIAFWMESFVEQLAPNSFLIYSFVPTATIESSPRVIDARGGGSVMYCQLLAATGSFTDCWHQAGSIQNVCQRENHRLTFTRR